MDDDKYAYMFSENYFVFFWLFFVSRYLTNFFFFFVITASQNEFFVLFLIHVLCKGTIR